MEIRIKDNSLLQLENYILTIQIDQERIHSDK